jgi:glycosyltransferase involved in cell wall biosynthesis
LLVELQKLGVDLLCKSTNQIDNVHPALKPFCVNFNSPLKTEVSLSYTIPLNLAKIDAKHKIQIYNYETDILPRGWGNMMNNQAHLILPSSQFAKEIFEKNGVKKEKMVVLPHGYDETLFNPQMPETPLVGVDNSKFKFLCIAAPHWRKGLDILLKAYIEEFKGDQDVVLILKSSMNSHEPQKAHFHVDLKQIISSLKKTHNYSWPEIKYIDYRVESLAGLYKTSNAVVLPTRAECFSLTVLEAAACQVPVITTDYGGHLDFLNHENSYLIDYVLRKCPKEGQYHEYQPNALISEPSHEDLKRLMRHVKNNKQEAEGKAQVAYSQISEKYKWSAVAKDLLTLIKDRGWNI